MNRHWDDRGLVEDLVARGVDDWIDFGIAIDIARRVIPAAGEGRTTLAIGIVSAAIAKGLVIAGVVSKGEFEAWSLSAGDAVERIVRDWSGLTADPRPGDIAWLCNTTDGDRLGAAVLERERQ
jgi:hypothetical protein